MEFKDLDGIKKEISSLDNEFITLRDDCQQKV